MLAVGDLEFQEKCLARIRELQGQGKTIIFVTHAPKQVAELCDLAVWLDRGEIRMQDPAREVARAYAEFVGVAAG
ncbi:MAG: ABC transporter ATP-binding protein [Thermoanaerobacter sp.]|nr:ABC transporter ATP-binding protein [Thermoanaerobacter sp.]